MSQKDNNLQKSKSFDGYRWYASGENECVNQQNEHFNVCMHNRPA